MVKTGQCTRSLLPGGSFIWPYTMATLIAWRFDINNARFLHFVVEVITFTSTLTNTSKHRQTTVLGGNVVDQLHHVYGFTNTGTTEQTNLTAFGKGADQVDYLDTGFQQSSEAASSS